MSPQDRPIAVCQMRETYAEDFGQMQQRKENPLLFPDNQKYEQGCQAVVRHILLTGN